MSNKLPQLKNNQFAYPGSKKTNEQENNTRATGHEEKVNLQSSTG